MRIHLGGDTPEWASFDGEKPAGPELDLSFEAEANEKEHTLFIRQENVKQDWTVTLNGKKLGSLFLFEADLIHTLSIPPNALRAGDNELRISTRALEDILIHSVAIGDGPRASLLSSAPISVSVFEENTAMPARLTVVDETGSLAAIHDFGAPHLATRPGVIYAAAGTARFALLPGAYTIYATRGPEYSLGEKQLITGTEPKDIRLELRREVNTQGWVASDTHIHTFTLSRHGDALLDERMITLAAEAVELPVATEHNQHADYSTAARATGLDRYFTVVPGNEVTTRRGHFNAFPVSPSGTPANYKLESWPELLKNIRQAPEVQVVILNHPTDTHSGFTPYAATNLNPVTGRNLQGDFAFTFDAMEVINSGAMRTDWMEPFRAWFALLNRGYKIVGVAGSDSHDVSRFIVGQGRTYIQGDDADPSNLDIARLCQNLKQGRAVVSLGLFPSLTIRNAPDPTRASRSNKSIASGPGDFHRPSGDFIELEASVDFPKWINRQGATHLTVYANGQVCTSFTSEAPKSSGQPVGFKQRMAKPHVDTTFILVAHTPGVTNAWWSIARPYQPSGPVWIPAMIGATNPVWFDADGDGQFTSPHSAAIQLARSSPTLEALLAKLGEYDWATAVQAAEILHLSGANLISSRFQRLLSSTAPQVHSAFADYIKTIPQ